MFGLQMQFVFLILCTFFFYCIVLSLVNYVFIKLRSSESCLCSCQACEECAYSIEI